MKKVIFLLAALLISACSAFSQGCLPDGIEFTTQAQIDSFQINYPGCSYIEGSVEILYSGDITNLEGLNSLDSIGGYLEIDCRRLKNLNGLNNLVKINRNLMIAACDSLVNLEGLSNLTTIGDNFLINYNVNLLNFEGLDNLN
ncbi:MAG TPA: hypothetical protein PLP88_09800, partial [Bacteroidales bacterium]|nr:hypothetical protein [Bacteroidales bacterium]